MILSLGEFKLKATDNFYWPLPTDLFPWPEVQQPAVQVSFCVEQTHSSFSALATAKHLPLSCLFPSFLLNPTFILCLPLHISFLIFSIMSSHPPLLILFHPDRHWFESNFDGIPSAALTMTMVKWRRTTTGHGWLQGQLWSLIVAWLSHCLYSPPSRGTAQLHFLISSRRIFWL